MRTFSTRSLLFVPAAVGLSIAVAAAPVAAVSWVKTTLTNAGGTALQDAAFQGHNAAVVWQAPGPITKIRTSTNNGSSFGATHIVEPGRQTRQASTALCGSDLYVAFAQNDSLPATPNLWRIYVDRDTTAGVTHEVSAADQTQDTIGRFPDVACSATKLWVSWEQKVGGQWHVYVNWAARSAASFNSTPMDLGLLASDAGKPVIAGSGNNVYVAWSTPSGTIRIHRWNDASGVTDLGERQLATGNPSGGGAGVPRIDASGGKVAVTWFDCGDMRARVSNDRGATWGSTRTLFTGACGSEFGGLPNSIAISGSRVLVAFDLFATRQTQHMVSTTNDFGSFTDHLAYAASDLLLLGFVHPSGATKVAGAVDEGTRVRFLRQP